MTAIYDSCHSGTILDLPFIYDCNGQPKQKKYTKAQEIIAQTKSSEADVILFSGCLDDQTSQEKSGSGACTSAFIETVKNGKNLTFAGLLSTMRDKLATDKFVQVIQMSTGYPTDMNIPFNF